MVTFIIADNQELTRAGIESVIAGDDVRIFHAPDKAELIDLLKQHGDSVVILDYTLFDFTDVDNLLIVGERFCQSRWLLISDDLTAEFLKRSSIRRGRWAWCSKTRACTSSARLSTTPSRQPLHQSAGSGAATQSAAREPVTASSLTCTELEILKAIAQVRPRRDCCRPFL
jgi:DNA-binding NarL/FixJ family response regulator